ncbi:hypothetical protein EVAR_96338_1 [Eumeta japonica]|uniref:Uncharacterized protein n=1 Tax=Eumeta variegata TaxID=151549 RepID=A0A4C1VV32_EUMVA|nr:hypothetical protein EVAR_96338_1 [Eumeta japonica]
MLRINKPQQPAESQAGPGSKRDRNWGRKRMWGRDYNQMCDRLRNRKRSRSSRPLYGDDAISYVQLKREGNICTVKCKICPEHKVHAKLYAVTLIVDEDDEKVTSIQCHDCVAAQAFSYSTAERRDVGVLGTAIELATGGRSIVLVGTQLILGGCKHALALVMWTHRRSEDPTPTEVACYWKNLDYQALAQL